jgi:ribosome-binding factor A
MPKEFSRTQRVGEVIQRQLAEIIRREMTRRDVGMITISTVSITPDLKSARIYITLLGGQLTPKETVNYLNESANQLRHHLSQRLTTRTTPRLQFVYDSSIEYGNHLTTLINLANKPKDE